MRASSLMSSLAVFLKTRDFAKRFQETKLKTVPAMVSVAPERACIMRFLAHTPLLLRGHNEENHAKIPYDPGAADGNGKLLCAIQWQCAGHSSGRKGSCRSQCNSHLDSRGHRRKTGGNQ